MNGGKKRLLIGAIAVVLVAAAVTVVLIIRSTSDEPVAGPPEPLNGRTICADNVIMYVKTDTDMQSVAPKLAADPQVAKVYTETKEQSWQHFQKIFASQPELIKLTRPETMPATITVRPADGVTINGLAAHLRELPQADQVQEMDKDHMPAGMKNPPPDASPPPCPPSGER